MFKNMKNLISSEGRSPLALSILSEYVYMIYRLLEAGADPNTADYNGDTPLIKAIWMTTSSNIEKNEITKICKALIRAGK
jgi:ankyrin repeat protein